MVVTLFDWPTAALPGLVPELEAATELAYDASVDTFSMAPGVGAAKLSPPTVNAMTQAATPVEIERTLFFRVPPPYAG